MPKESNVIGEGNNYHLRTVFISGLSYESTEESLKNFFKDCGDIQELKLPKYQDSNRNIGYCHMTFEEEEAAQNALKLKGHTLDGRYQDIELAKGARTYTNETDIDSITSRTIFVKNQPYTTNEDEVGDLFKSCGEILGVRLVYNPQQGHFKGFGYIDFKSVNGAKNAMGFNGKLFKGRSIKVDSEAEKPKGSYKQKYENVGNERYNSQHQSEIREKKIRKDKKEDKSYRSDIKNLSNNDPRKYKMKFDDQNDETWDN